MYVLCVISATLANVMKRNKYTLAHEVRAQGLIESCLNMLKTTLLLIIVMVNHYFLSVHISSVYLILTFE